MKKNTIKLTKKQLFTYTSAIFVLLVFVILVLIPVLQGSMHFLVVLSGSMSPAIKAGDVVVTNSEDPSNININDVITFKDNNSEESERLVTHRVVNITKENDQIFFKTKGDANSNSDPKLVSSSNIVGKVILTLPFVGYLPGFVSTPLGFLLMIIIPGILIVSYESKKIFKELKKDKES